MTEYAWRFSAGQIVGERENQEDDYAALDLSDAGRERLLFAVADGMGGHQGAATVAQLAVRRFCELAQGGAAPLSQQLNPALSGANVSIAAAAIQDPSLEGAGCTLLATAIEDGELSWISVGDCSLFLFRDGKLKKLNDDHSMRAVFSERVASGRMSARAAAKDPRRNSLRSALSGGEIRLISRSREPFYLKPGDAIVLASDGIETLSSRKITRFLKRATHHSPSAAVERFFREILAARARRQDNTTIIFYRFMLKEDVHTRRPGKQKTSRSKGFTLLFLLMVALLIAYFSGLIN